MYVFICISMYIYVYVYIYICILRVIWQCNVAIEHGHFLGGSPRSRHLESPLASALLSVQLQSMEENSTYDNSYDCSWI